MHAAIRRTLGGLAATGLLLASSLPVHAAWSSSVVDSSYFLTRPSLRVDSADHVGIAYQRIGDSPGIFYSTNATASWVSGRASSGSDYFPSLRFDNSDKAHIAFARLAGSPGVYVTDNSTGSWSAPTLVAADLDPTLPSLSIDGSNYQGIAWASNFSFAPGLYFATNATGSWVTTRVTTGTWENTPSLQFDASGNAHVLFARYAPSAPGLYYATNAIGSWVVTRLTTTYDDDPSFVFDGAGKIHAAFHRFATGSDATMYATNATGSWVITPLPYGNPATFGPPSLQLDGNGNPNIFVSIYETATPAYSFAGHLFHYVFSSNTWQGSSDLPLDASSGNDEFPSLAYLSDGTTIDLAFRRTYPSAGIRFWSAFGSSSVVDGSHTTAAAAIDLGPSSARNISFNTRDGDGGTTIFATGTGAGWTLDTPGTGNPSIFATDIATDGNGKVRILDGAAYYSNATSLWTSDTSLPFGGQGEVAVDGANHAHIVYSDHVPPYWQINYKTDATGSWVADSPYSCCAFEGDVEPTIALDPNGKPHIAWVFPDGAGGASLVYQNRISGSWTSTTTLLGGTNAWPSIAVDGANKVHIAVIHYGSSPGIYYLTNKSGAWTSTRLTRSYSDGAPSIAIDASNHVYIATTRGSWAANPGVYVITNATGSWVKARVVPTFDAGAISLVVTSGGLARMVFSSSTGVLEYENSTTTLTVSAGTVAWLVRSQLRLAAETGLAVGASGATSTQPGFRDGQSEPTTDSMTRTTPPRRY